MDQIREENFGPAVDQDVAREARPLAHEVVHETTLSILSGMPPGTLLDVPAGEGALAARLIECGFNVSCCDLYPEIFRLEGIQVKRGDLSGTLPYESNCFDYVTCIEGLEHIENPQQAIRGFRRVMKPGGSLVVSVPNILNVEERLKWLINGYTSHFKPLSQQSLESLRNDFGGMEEVALHVNPIGYSELRYTLEKYGFNIVKLYRDKPKARQWLYWPIVMLIRAVNSFSSESKKRERWARELQSDEILLGGNTLIVHARLETKDMESEN